MCAKSVLFLSARSLLQKEVGVRNEHTGFSIGPDYATFYKSGGGTVRLRNITLEQVKDAAWLLVPFGIMLVGYGLEVLFSKNLPKEYEVLFVSYMLAAALCLFVFKIDKVFIFGSLGYITVSLGESGVPQLASLDALWMITLFVVCLVLVSLQGFLEKIWTQLLAFLFVVVATLPATIVFQNPKLIAKVTGFDNELIGIVTVLLGIIIFVHAFFLYAQHLAVEEQKDLIIDDSYPHPDDYVEKKT